MLFRDFAIKDRRMPRDSYRFPQRDNSLVAASTLPHAHTDELLPETSVVKTQLP